MLEVVVHICNLSIQEAGTGGPGVKGHPWLLSKCEANLGCMRPCLIKGKN